MRGDRHRLQQVIGNLLTNAVKFTPEGGTVSVRSRREGDTAILKISDTGIGIAPELLPHIFDRFRQAKSSTKRKYGGLGLGLTIVKHLVELHEGSVSARSAGDGKGVTFTIELPLLARQVSRADQRRAAYSGEDEISVKLLKEARILVVDDDQDSLDLMCFALEQQGAQVICCNSGREALHTLENNRFELVISDLGMTEIDGYDLIRQIRENEKAAGIRQPMPAIALTGYVSADDRERVLLAGFQMHLPKPVDLDKLLAAALEFTRK